MRITKTVKRIPLGLQKNGLGFCRDYKKTVWDSAWIPIFDWFWIPKKKDELVGDYNFFWLGIPGDSWDSNEKKTNFGHICSPGLRANLKRCV